MVGFDAREPKSWSDWSHGNIPNLSKSITIKQRWVFDEEGCDWDYVYGTQQKRNYAIQLAVFVDNEPEISCLILSRPNRQDYWQRFFSVLTPDFKSPSAVAAFLSALWIEMDSPGAKKFLQNYINSNPNISALVERIDDVKPYYFSPCIDFNRYRDNIASIPLYEDLYDDDVQSKIYSIDADGNILWYAEKDGVFLNNPIIYQSDSGIENAINYIMTHGLSVTDEWQDYLKKNGYIFLKEGTIRKIISLHLNKLETFVNDKHIVAIRDFNENEFTWTVYVDDEDLWTLYPAYDHNHLRIESTNISEENIPSGVKSLIHAILDGCGKTMSPAQLGILNLIPFDRGGDRISDAENLPLSRKIIEINETMSWVQESVEWNLIKNKEKICRFSYSPAGTEFFSLPSTLITDDIASAIVYFSKLLQQITKLPNHFSLKTVDELSENFPSITFCSDINEHEQINDE